MEYKRNVCFLQVGSFTREEKGARLCVPSVSFQPQQGASSSSLGKRKVDGEKRLEFLKLEETHGRQNREELMSSLLPLPQAAGGIVQGLAPLGFMLAVPRG